MSQVSFDTHAATRKLERAGCPAPQAEAVVAIVTQATGVSIQMAKDLERIKFQVETNMATKGDLYRALWVQGGVLATLILTLAGSMLGFALYLLAGS